MNSINTNTRIQSMVKDHPETVKVLSAHHLDCIGCQGIKHETVERGAIAHGLDVNVLLRDLNAAIAAKA